MFTVKVRRFDNRDVEDATQDKIDFYECVSLSKTNNGVVLNQSNGDEPFIPRPDFDKSGGLEAHPTGDRPDWYVHEIIVENSNGKTTEVIRG